MIPSRPPQVKETVAARIEEAAALLAVLQDPSLSSGGSQARRNATEHALLTVAAELRDALFVYASRAARDAALAGLSDTQRRNLDRLLTCELSPEHASDQRMVELRKLYAAVPLRGLAESTGEYRQERLEPDYAPADARPSEPAAPTLDQR